MVGVTAIPTRLLLQPARSAIADVQKRLADAQAEAASGRHSDVGLALGGRTGAVLALRVQLAASDQSDKDMKQTALKAETVQNTLSTITTLADRFRSTLTGARGADNGRSLSATFARSALDTLYDSLSITQDGQYLFSGLASDTPPLTPYNDGPRQAAVDTFQAAFGFPPDDPSAASLTTSQISTFLDGPFDALFTDPGWSDTWSMAADDTPVQRLPSGEGLGLATTANAPFARTIAKAFATMELLGRSTVNGSAFTAAADKALMLVSEAQVKIGSEQARIGIGQARLKEVQDGVDRSKAGISKAIAALENIDPYEAATRVNLLMTQLEGSYALTSRINKMSLLSYL